MIDKHLLIKYIKNSPIEKITGLYQIYDELSIFKEYGLLTEITFKPNTEILDGISVFILKETRNSLISNLKAYLSKTSIEINDLTRNDILDILFDDIMTYELKTEFIPDRRNITISFNL